jgi:putative flippase GtrA
VLKKIKSEENVKKILKYILTWWIIYFLNIWITLFCKEVLEFSSNISYFITMTIIIIYSFIMSLKFIFKASFSLKLLFKYLFYLISFAIINYFSVINLNNLFWDNFLYIIIIIVNIILATLKYFVYNNFVFNKTKTW